MSYAALVRPTTRVTTARKYAGIVGGRRVRRCASRAVARNLRGPRVPAPRPRTHAWRPLRISGRVRPVMTEKFSRSEVRALYDRPLLPLLDEARAVHRQHHPDNEVQLCTLLSVKTGGCPEDCSYCPQSSHYDTNVGPEKMLDVEHVIASARRAKELGSTRFCMGAAWREVKDGPAFDRVLDDGPRREGPRPRGLRHARHAHRGAGQAPRRRGARRLQPQPRHEPRELPLDHQDAHLRRSPAHARERPQGGHHRLLGRHHRHGREHRRPLRDAPHAREPRAAARERARSTRSSRSRARRSRTCRRSIRSSSCA